MSTDPDVKKKMTAFLDALLRSAKVARAARESGISAETAWSWLRQSRNGRSAFERIEHQGRVAWFHEHADQIRMLLDESFVEPTGSRVHMLKAWEARERRRERDRLIAEAVERAARPDIAGERRLAYAPAAQPFPDPHRRVEPDAPQPEARVARSNWVKERSHDRAALAEGVHSYTEAHPGVKEGGFCITADRPTPKVGRAEALRTRGLPSKW